MTKRHQKAEPEPRRETISRLRELAGKSVVYFGSKRIVGDNVKADEREERIIRAQRTIDCLNGKREFFA